MLSSQDNPMITNMASDWHDHSDHAADGTPFGGALCNCVDSARRAVRLGWVPNVVNRAIQDKLAEVEQTINPGRAERLRANSLRALSARRTPAVTVDSDHQRLVGNLAKELRSALEGMAIIQDGRRVMRNVPSNGTVGLVGDVEEVGFEFDDQGIRREVVRVVTYGPWVRRESVHDG